MSGLSIDKQLRFLFICLTVGTVKVEKQQLSYSELFYAEHNFQIDLGYFFIGGAKKKSFILKRKRFFSKITTKTVTTLVIVVETLNIF